MSNAEYLALDCAEEAIFRSADMTYVELYIPSEISREVVCILGNIGAIMFKDMNVGVSAFQRGHVNQIRKYDDIDRLVQYLITVSERHKDATWKYTYHPVDVDDPMGTFGSSTKMILESLNHHTIDTINDVSDDIVQFEARVRQLDESLIHLKRRLNVLIEERHVVFETGRFLEVNPNIGGRIRSSMDVEEFNLSADQDTQSDQLSDFSFDLDTDEPTRNSMELAYHNKFMLTGSISRAKVAILNKILWRILRGNLFFHNIPIEQKLLEGDELIEKDCFIVFTHGDVLLKRVRKVVESLNGTLFPISTSHSTIQSLNDKITDLEQICTTTEQTLHTELLIVNDQLPIWNVLVKREKYIYATLNLFRQESQAVVAEGWVPSSRLEAVRNALRDFGEVSASASTAVLNVISTNKSPPTYHKTNKFTEAFQNIVDAYGTATYKEVNPGLATIVTFPFMFAIMFGDLGHGFILTLCGLVLVLREKKFGQMKRDEIFDMAFSGRYVLLLMGLFSIYTGLLYNDIFSLSMTLFNSGWKWPSGFKEGDTIEATQVGVYPFGLDYAWHGTENALLFSNSYKMKLSILMGFIHMTYSFMFSLVNYRFKKSRVDIVGNFIPGLIFMQSIFGYLSWAIVYKWSKDWIKDNKPAPGLLNMLINMFLSPGVIEEPLFRGQSVLQIILLLAALVCVPWLLLYKPLVLKKLNQEAINKGYSDMHEQEIHERLQEAQENSEDTMVVADYSKEHEHASFNFGDIMIHQVIHTIEFCLNCISHTASYLRLWALSLAHAQLSTVLWTMTIANAFSPQNSGSPLAVAKVILLFGMWFVLTVCILVLMEGTSAMLHALRLHWVEAMSKFFEGEGYAYEPFSFDKVEQQVDNNE
ncbi:Stv1 [Kluyveromyces lactis]|nr:Stv1 [Kluyveromyces lactis]